MNDAPENSCLVRDRYLSYSMISDWLRCRHLWHVKYEEGIRPVIKNRQPEIGDAVHRSIAMALRGEDPYKGYISWKDDFLRKAERNLFDEEVAVLDDMETDVVATTERALKFIKATGLTTVTWNGIDMIEQRIVFPLAGWKGFVAIFDWVARDPEGAVWLIDWKVRKTFQPQLSEDVSLQMMIYQAVCQLQGLRVDGSRTLQIMPGELQAPKVNANGTISRTDIRTDWETYKARVLLAGGDPADYDDMRIKLEAKEFQRWLFQYRSQTEVATAWNEIVMPLSKEVNRKTKVITRNLNFINCMNCDVQTLCLAALRGHDTNLPDYAPVGGDDELTEGLQKWRKTRRT